MVFPKNSSRRRKNRLNEFLNKSSINGLRILLHYTHFRYARLLWKILIVAVIIWTQFIIINLIIEYIGQPTELHMSTKRVHIANSPFPAFGVCDGNKFSRKKLQAFAAELFRRQQRYRPFYLARSEEEMFHYLFALDDFYLFPFNEGKTNQTVLEKLDMILKSTYNTSQYPMRDILKDLGPDCNQLIIKGIVYGIPVNISEYFRKRLTSSGVCCMFNYKRESYANDISIREDDNNFAREHDPVQFQANSILNSIQFVLQADPKDATTRDFDIDAFVITVFPQNDYASIQSSHIGEILVNYYSIVEIPIQPEFYDSTDNVRQFDPQVRNCYFPDEGQKLLNRTYYSIDECLLHCRSESMLKHCGCIVPPMASTHNLTICNLIDVKCLREWNAMWYDWNYFDYVQKASDEDYSETGHKCPQCLPTCDGVKFRIYLNEMTMRRTNGEAYSHGLLKGIDDKKPLAIIKLFFKQRFAHATEMDIVGDWVVQLNRFGGIMGLMYGFSIISLIEIFYFASGKCFTLYWKQWRSKIKSRLSAMSAAKKETPKYHEDPPPAYGLYWNELQPKRRSYIKLFYEKNY